MLSNLILLIRLINHSLIYFGMMDFEMEGFDNFEIGFDNFEIDFDNFEIGFDMFGNSFDKVVNDFDMFVNSFDKFVDDFGIVKGFGMSEGVFGMGIGNVCWKGFETFFFFFCFYLWVFGFYFYGFLYFLI